MGPHLLSGPSCGHLPLSRLGCRAREEVLVGLWCVGLPSALSHTLSVTPLSLVCYLLIPDRINWVVPGDEMRAPTMGLGPEWAMGCGLRYSTRTHTHTRGTLDGLIWIAGVTRPLWKGSVHRVGFAKGRILGSSACVHSFPLPFYSWDGTRRLPAC